MKYHDYYRIDAYHRIKLKYMVYSLFVSHLFYIFLGKLLRRPYSSASVKIKRK